MTPGGVSITFVEKKKQRNQGEKKLNLVGGEKKTQRGVKKTVNTPRGSGGKGGGKDLSLCTGKNRVARTTCRRKVMDQ